MKKQILILFIIFNLNMFSQEGVLDPSFGNNGVVSIGFGAIFSNDIATCMDIQSDGKIVVAGYSENKIALARFNSNGTLDNTFGTGGKVTTEVYPDGSRAADVKIQNDGKIVLAGVTYHNISPNFNSYFLVTRYNSDGSPDNSFSEDGKFIGDFGGSYNYAHSLAIQIDGKIIVAGEASNSALLSTTQMAILRLNSNGTIDNTFGVNGRVMINIQNRSSKVTSVTLKTSNLFSQKIILSGSVYQNSSEDDFAIVQLNLSGSLDNNFGSGGIVTTAISSNYDNINKCKIQPDGKILVAGSTEFFKIALARYNADGTLDNTFSGDGKQIITLGDNCDALDVVFQNNNKILTVGNYSNGNQKDILLVRYSTAGTLDYTFGTNGYVTTSVSDTTDFGVSAKFQSDGKLIVAGYSIDGLGYGNFIVLRYIITSNLVNVENEIEIPTEFNLDQNYPNPFNPSTKISWQSPVSGYQTLKVYDILGNEVATLVNEEKSAGSYEVEFDASRLSSGTYFYRLTVGEFTEIKKLMLIK